MQGTLPGYLVSVAPTNTECLPYINALPMVSWIYAHFIDRKIKARDLDIVSKKSDT